MLALVNYYSGLKILLFFKNCIRMFSSENDQVWKQRIWYICAKSFIYIGASTILKHLKFQHLFWFTRLIGLQDQLNKNFNSILKFSSIILTNYSSPNESISMWCNGQQACLARSITSSISTGVLQTFSFMPRVSYT